MLKLAPSGLLKVGCPCTTDHLVGGTFGFKNCTLAAI